MFALTPTQPLVDGVSLLTASTTNYWRSAIAQAIDGTAGGQYNPSAQVQIGGAGLRISGVTGLELDATSICKQDAGGTFNWSGTQNVLPGGLISLTGSGLNFAEIQVNSSGFILIENGGALNVLSGGQFQVNSGATFNLYATETVESGGLIDVLSGGSIKIESGGILNVYGGVSIESGATETVLSGGTLQVNAGGNLTTDMPAATATPTSANNIKSLGVAKAWAVIQTDGAGGATLVDGFNVSSTFSFPAFVSSHGIEITWKMPFASASYCVIANVGSFVASGPNENVYAVGPLSMTANNVTLAMTQVIGTGTGGPDPSTQALTIYVEAFGRQ